MNFKDKKYILGYLFSMALILFGFFVGKKSVRPVVETKTVVEYRNLPPVCDTLRIFEPVMVVCPADTVGIIEQCVMDSIYYELFPEKIVERKISMTSEDTLRIVSDWATRRSYSETIFDNDTIGKCDVSAEIQYNRLKEMSYKFVPVQKTVITEKKYYEKDLFEPYVGMTMFNGGRTFVDVGVFLQGNYGFSITYGNDYENGHNLGFGFKYKF